MIYVYCKVCGRTELVYYSEKDREIECRNCKAKGDDIEIVEKED